MSLAMSGGRYLARIWMLFSILVSGVPQRGPARFFFEDSAANHYGVAMTIQDGENGPSLGSRGAVAPLAIFGVIGLIEQGL